MQKHKSKNFLAYNVMRIQLSDGMDRHGLGRMQVLKTGSFLHPKAPNGRFDITKEILFQLKANFDNNVRRLEGGEVALDWNHDTEGPAAGWIKALEVVTDDEGPGAALFMDVDLTADGEKSLIDKAYRFVSADLDFNYIDNESGASHGPVLMGAGLVNRPHIKGMRAVFSEENEINQKQNGVFSMSPEDMMKKIGELESAIAELKRQMSLKDDQLQEGDKEKMELKEKVSKLETTLSEVKEENGNLKTEKENVEKESTFNVLLSEGKITPAQKEDFLATPLEVSKKLFANAPKLNLKEQGNGGTGNTNNEGDVSPADEIEAKAAELQKENENLTLSEAYSQVMRDNPKLAEAYEAGLETVSLSEADVA